MPLFERGTNSTRRLKRIYSLATAINLRAIDGQSKTKKLVINTDIELDENAVWNWKEEKIEKYVTLPDIPPACEETIT